MKPLLILGALVLAGAAVAGGPSYHDFSLQTHWERQFLTGMESTNSLVECEILGTSYWAAADQEAGLVFWSLATGEPQRVGSLALAGIEQDVVIDGFTAHVVSQPDRLATLIVANPAAPMLLATSLLPASPVDLERADTRLLVACEGDGLLVFDPTIEFGLPRGVVGTWSGTAHETKYRDGVAYVRGDHRLTTLDLSDPTAPVELDALSVGSSGRLLLGDGVAYLSSEDGIAEIDITDPADLTPLRLLPGAGYGAHSALAPLDGGLLHGVPGQLVLVDLLSEEIVWRASHLTGGEAPRGIVARDGWLGLACGPDGMQVLRWQGTGYAPASAAFGPGGLVYDPAIAGDLLLLHDGGVVSCYRLDGPAPTLAWTWDPDVAGVSITTLSADGDRLYLGDSRGRVRILRVDAEGAEPLSWFATGGIETQTIAPLSGSAAGHIAVYVVPKYDWMIERTLRIFDVTDPQQPILLASLEYAPYSDLAVDGSTVILWDRSAYSSGIQLYDLSDPATIRPALTLPRSGEFTATAADGWLYLQTAPGVTAFSIADPYHLGIGTLAPLPPDAGPVVVFGEVGYVTGSHLVLDLSDPLLPVPVGATLNAEIGTYDLCAAGPGRLVLGNSAELVLLPAHGAGWTAVDPAPPADRSLTVAAYPNPFNPRLRIEFEMPTAGEARARLFDVRGRRVAELSRTVTAAGPVRMEWNGLTAAGQAAPSGVYFVEIATPDGTAVRKVVLAR